MSKYYKLNNLPAGSLSWEHNTLFGKARGHQPINKMESHFEIDTLNYLSELVINHIADSMQLDNLNFESLRDKFNDFSFITAPSYKALEGFLFQVATDLVLPSSGNNKLAGSYYFDEEKIDKHIDKLLKELESKAENENKLDKYEKRDIKDRIKEMKGFLQHYRHTPAHFYGEPINTIEKAHRNIMVIYSAIDNTTKILLKSGLIHIKNEIY